MRVILYNFRCYAEETKFEFEDKKLTLLKAPSGRGKSTIFNAIEWCLYGKLRSITNHSYQNSKTWVEFKIDDIIVFRQSKPRLLKVELNDKVYEDQVGQNIINSRFGNEDVWRASSYLSQNNRCGLLALKQSEAMDLLNSISFGNENPEIYIQKIDEKIKDVKVSSETASGIFKYRCDELRKYIDLNKPESKYSLPKEEILINKDRLIQLNAEKKRLTIIVSEYHRQSGRNTQLLSQINSLEYELSLLPNINMELVSSMKYQVQELTKEMRNIEDKIALETKLKKFSNLYNFDHIDDLDIYLTNTIIQEKQYSDMITKTSLLGIEPTVEALQAEKEVYEYFKKILPLIPKKKEYDNIKSQLDKIPIGRERDKIMNDYNEKKLQLNNMNLSKDVHLCPHCSKGIRIVKGSLVASDKCPINIKDIAIIEDEINKISLELRNDDIRVNYINRLGSIISKYPDIEMIPDLVIPDDLDKRYSICNKIDIIQSPEVSSIVIKNYIEAKKIKTLLNGIHTTKTLNECKSKIDNFNKEVRAMESKFQEREILKQNLAKLIVEKKQIILDDTVIKLFEDVENEYNEKNDRVIRGEIANHAMMMKDELKDMKISIEKSSKRLTTLYRLKKIIQDLECKTLENTIDMINSTLETIGSQLFDDPILIQLDLYREIKTSQSRKPSLNLNIAYRGGEYKDLNGLSGGEADRCSLALMIAINLVSGSPFLLLDESLSSIDTNLKEICLKCLTKVLKSSKTIICVNHEGVEGYYQNIVNLEN